MSNKAKAHLNADGWLFYQCPGCDQHHGITTQSTNASGARWSFNGDLHHPTVSPSVHCLPYRNPKGQLLFVAAITSFAMDRYSSFQTVITILQERPSSYLTGKSNRCASPPRFAIADQRRAA